MRITYLGTAAAEGWPALFCNCEYCKAAKRTGGKNLRTRSQALINDDLLLDFPPDTFSHMLCCKADFSAIKYCFVTHSHRDHWVPADMLLRSETYFAHGMTAPRLDFYGNEEVLRKYDAYGAIIDKNYKDLPVYPHLIESFETVTTGDYAVTALPADHAPGEKALVYLIRQGGKALLYLHDTGMPPEKTVDYLAKNHVKADLISYDCTNVILKWDGRAHMGLNNIAVLRERFKELGISDEKTVSVISHFSHNGKLIHDELEPLAAGQGLITAYDGMTVEF